jgi:glycosyltransferase involved in cell wall biosynthesis
MDRSTLSLCMMVRNEARALGRCLDSVGGLADEMVVVDTGSTDATVAIARRYGAQVAAFDFTFVDFAAARNAALARAAGGWILVLDADETLEPAAAPWIREAVARDENAGYYLERVNHHRNAAEDTMDYIVRLFPNRPLYRFRGRVHETVDASILAGGGRLRRTGIRIHHDFAGDPERRRQRNLRYIEILREEIAGDPEDLSRLVFLGAEYHQLGMFGEATRVAERLARLRPLDAEAHLHAGVYHLLYQTDRRRARADFREALRLRPEYAEAQSFLELMNEQDGSPQPAARDS